MITPSSAKGFFDQMPNEITRHILRFVGDPATTASVCRLWNHIVSDPSFYTHTLETIEWCCGSSEAFQRLKSYVAISDTCDDKKVQTKKIYTYLANLYRHAATVSECGNFKEHAPLSVTRLSKLVAQYQYEEDKVLTHVFYDNQKRLLNLDDDLNPLLKSFHSGRLLMQLGRQWETENDVLNPSSPFPRFTAAEPPRVVSFLLKGGLAAEIRKDLQEKPQEFANLFEHPALLAFGSPSFFENDELPDDLQLWVLPEELAKMAPNLNAIHFINRRWEYWKTLPPSLLKFKNLRELGCDYRQIFDLSQEVLGNFPNLQELGIRVDSEDLNKSYEKLSELPKKINISILMESRRVNQQFDAMERRQNNVLRVAALCAFLYYACSLMFSRWNSNTP